MLTMALFGSSPASSQTGNAAASLHGGAEIYQAACATCHGPDGRGSPPSVVGFSKELPDFSDCSINTVEQFNDWDAVVHRGGRIRGLDRHMPAFGEALSNEQIESVVKHVWKFCGNPSWPRGDLNFPRAFFTEKAFPENEAVWTAGVTTSGSKAVTNDIVYEHRIGARGQYEIRLPVNFQQGEAGGSWSRGVGDVEVAIRRTLYASLERGSIFAAGGAVTLPTGRESNGLGSGFTTFEPFAMVGQSLGGNGFVQVHTGIEIPSDHQKGRNEGFVRTALGYTLAQDRGFGRAWSPMLEVLMAKPAGAAAEWDLVPQVQMTLSKLQHIRLGVGVRVPVNERQERKPRFVTYFLWDWFDGGLFEFWK